MPQDALQKGSLPKPKRARVLTEAQIAARRENIKKANAANPRYGKQPRPLSELACTCFADGRTTHRGSCPRGIAIKRRSEDAPKTMRFRHAEHPFTLDRTCWSGKRRHSSRKDAVIHIEAGDTTLCGLCTNEAWKSENFRDTGECLAAVGCRLCRRIVADLAKR